MAHCIDCVYCEHSSQGYYCTCGVEDSGFFFGLGWAIGSAVFSKKADFSRFRKKKIEEYWSEEEAESRAACGSFRYPKRCITCGHCKIGKTLITRNEYYYCSCYGHSDQKKTAEEVNERNYCDDFISK